MQYWGINLRWFPSFALRIPTAHDFAPFLLNELGDSYFLLHKFNENNILNNWEKNWLKSMATFLANET